MTYFNSNYTTREHLRIHGTLPYEQIEQLVEVGEQVEKLNEALIEVKEAMMPFSEDRLNGVFRLLVDLKGRLRGENRSLVERIMEGLSDAESELRGDVEYCNEQIKGAAKTITKMIEATQ